MALASCNSPKSAGENPFFTQWDTPFGVPPFDKIRAEHFMPAFERGMSLHDAEIDAITSNNDEPTFENTILAYDNAGQMLAQTGARRWDSTPSRADCSGRPTTLSCAPAPCSTPDRKPG